MEHRMYYFKSFCPNSIHARWMQTTRFWLWNTAVYVWFIPKWKCFTPHRIPKANYCKNYPFMKRQMLKVGAGVSKSLQGVCQIKWRWEIVAVCAQNCVHHRQVLRVVLSLGHSNKSTATFSCINLSQPPLRSVYIQWTKKNRTLNFCP